jgi:hypothetical protein
MAIDKKLIDQLLYVASSAAHVGLDEIVGAICMSRTVHASVTPHLSFP